MPGVLTISEDGVSQRHVFEQQAVVGRDPDCDVPLASRSVSRRHALLERTATGWSLRDLGSANGTFVSGGRVTEAPLSTGAALRFGEVEAVFEMTVKATSSAERLVSSLSIPLSVPPARKARPVAVFVVTTVGVLLLAAATVWARYCDRPAKSGAVAAPIPVSAS